MSDAIKHITDDIFFFHEDSPLVNMHCACNTVQLLWLSRLPFSETMPPQQPGAECVDYKFRESYSSMSMSHESERLKKSRSVWLNSGNALIQHLSEKMWFLCFPVLPGSAEAHIIWGGIVKCLLIAYFISKISVKKYQNAFMYVKVTANQRWDVFWDTV